MKNEIEEMNKAVRCLALELPEQVFLDFFGQWATFRDSLITPSADVQERAKEWKTVTDNDLIEAAKLFHSEYEWTIKERTAFHVVVECKDYRIWFWLTDDDFIDFEELYHGEENIQAHGGESEPCSSYRTIIDIIDYFRYRGYNLPNKFAGASSGMHEYWMHRCKLAENFIEETPCDPDVTNPQAEAYKKYKDFLAGAPIPAESIRNDSVAIPSSLSSMQEENERLRKALEKIIENLSGWEGTDTMMGIAIKNALNALNKQQ